VLTISKPAGTPVGAEIFYTLDGSDPRLVGGVANSAAAHGNGPFNITINESTQVKARIRSGTTWSAVIDARLTVPGLLPVRITELHYHPADMAGVANAEDLEFIELLNTGNVAIDMEGVQIREFASTPYTFGSGISLAGGARLIVARNPAVFRSVYGAAVNVAPVGYGSANLSDGGERIALIGPLGEVLHDFEYDDVAPWPTSADGTGYSLEVIDPLGDAANPSNWRASHYYGGSPGGDGLFRLGDYDRNGIVNQQDYQRWRESYGLRVPPGMGADGNGNGTVDTADFVLWRRGMAVSPPAAAAAVDANAVADLPAAVAAAQPQRAADIQDRAVAALYPASEANAATARALARVRPAFRPAVAGDIDRQRTPQLLLDIAMFGDESDQNGATLPARRTADDHGDMDAGQSLHWMMDDMQVEL
jgi:hypothetical protein